MGTKLVSFKEKGVDVTLWENDNGKLTASVQKRYKVKDTENEWKNTNSFFYEELVVLRAKVAEAIKAWEEHDGKREKPTEESTAIVQEFEEDDIPW